MASSLIMKKLVSPNLLGKLRPVVTVAHQSLTRRFNTSAVREYDRDDRDVDVDHRVDGRVFSPFGDIFGSSLSTRNSLSQLLNMVDQFMESPISSSMRRNWDARESEDGLHLRLDMPGLSKDDVKVSVEQNTLIIRGEGKDLEDDDGGRRYSSRIDLPEKLYKTNEIKAEMKNGILKVFVPKIKEEERKDVYHVNVE